MPFNACGSRLEQEAGGAFAAARLASLRAPCSSQARFFEPDYAPLMDDMFFEAGGDIPIDRFIAPRVEVELAFVLGKRWQDLGSRYSMFLPRLSS